LTRRFAYYWDLSCITSQIIKNDSAWRQCRGELDLLAKERNSVQKSVAVSRKKGGTDPEGEARIRAIVEEFKEKEV
jgi:seryl-tRNA synthetase